jgi:hypothetical protein
VYSEKKFEGEKKKEEKPPEFCSRKEAIAGLGEAQARKRLVSPSRRRQPTKEIPQNPPKM